MGAFLGANDMSILGAKPAATHVAIIMDARHGHGESAPECCQIKRCGLHMLHAAADYKVLIKRSCGLESAVVVQRHFGKDGRHSLILSRRQHGVAALFRCRLSTGDLFDQIFA